MDIGVRVRVIHLRRPSGQDKARAREGDLQGCLEAQPEPLPLGREAALEAHLERDRPDRLDGQADRLPVDRPAVPADHLQGLGESRLIDLVKGHRRVGEGLVLDGSDRIPPDGRDAAPSEHGPQDAAGAGRVAVGVLAAPRRDLERPAEIAPAVEQADDDIGPVDPGVDIARPEDEVRTADVLGPLALDLKPGLLPVGRIRPKAGDDVPDAPGEARLRGQDLQGLLDDPLDVGADEGQAVHGRDIDPAVPAVAVVHDVADPVRDLRRRVDHARAHQPREIGLDLEIDVVGMGRVQPVAGLRRHQTAKDVVPGGLVGVPQRIAGVSKGPGVAGRGRVDALAGHDIDEGQVHVDVIVEPRRGLEQ